MKLQANLFDGTILTLSKGFELQQILDHTSESFNHIPKNLKVDLCMRITTPHILTSGFPVPENGFIGIEKRNLISEIFTKERMEKSQAIFKDIWNNWVSSKVLNYVVVPTEHIDIRKPYLYQNLTFKIGVTVPTEEIRLLDLLVIFSMLGQSAAYNTSIKKNGNTSSEYNVEIKIYTKFTNREATALLEQIELSNPTNESG